MMLSHEMLDRYSTSIIFFNVLASSLGFPVPSTTILVTISASVTLAHAGSVNTLTHFVALLGVAVAGGLIGDFAWFLAGRRYGKRIQTLLSELSPSVRNRSTGFESVFTRFGPRVLVFARFVPGLSLVAVPLCGSMTVGTRSFIFHDCISIALWVFASFTAGTLLARHLDVLLTHAFHCGWQAIFLSLLPALFIVFRCITRQLRRSSASQHNPRTQGTDSNMS
jgi:membrane protein DedA with SNARE-associated domain